MSEIKIIDIRKNILLENDVIAENVRKKIKENHITLMNLMASPGAGKTSVILNTIEALSSKYRIAVIEGDLDSIVDAQKISEKNVPTVQLRTGSGCHLDATMVDTALDKLDLPNLDLIIIENIGNLVCPAQFDVGANTQVMITSVPEGDDKVLKYPPMFLVCDALIVNKIDYLPDPGFNMDVLETRVHNLNPAIDILPLSCRSGENFDKWVQWLDATIQKFK